MLSGRNGFKYGLTQLQNRTNLESLAGRGGGWREHEPLGVLEGKLRGGWEFPGIRFPAEHPKGLSAPAEGWPLCLHSSDPT